MQSATGRSMRDAAIVAVLSAPVAAGLTALVWQFPVVVAGEVGRSVGAMYAAALTMIIFMTLFSVFGGILAIALVGAGAGYLVRGRSARWHVVAGGAVGILAAVVVAVFSAVVT